MGKTLEKFLQKKSAAKAAKSTKETAPKKSQQPKTDSDDEESTQVVNTDFDFMNPNPDHFHPIKNLIGTSIRGVINFDASSATDAICTQGNCGSVVLSDPNDSDSVVGISTIMNFKQWEGTVPGIKDLKASTLKYAEEHALDQATKDAFGKAVGNQHAGIYLRATFANLPQPVIPPLLNSLILDVAWSVDECPPELKDFYRLQQIVFVDRLKVQCNAKGTLKLDPELIDERVVDTPVSKDAPEAEKKKKKKTLKAPTAKFYQHLKELARIALYGSEEEVNAMEGEELPPLDTAAMILNSDAFVLWPTGRELDDSTVAVGEKKRKIAGAVEFGLVSVMSFKALKETSKLLDKINEQEMKKYGHM